MILSLVLASVLAHAQIQNEPVEIITAAPPTTFSERAGIWPADSLPPSDFANDKSTLSDRWNTVPGVESRSEGSPTLSVRGSAQSDRVLQLFDGAPLNMADGAGASTLLIPTEVMSDVSLIKGPSSVFYGSSAMAGSVDYRLRYFDQPTLQGSLADAGGEFGDRHAAFVLPISRGNHPVAQFSFMTERDPGTFLYQSTTSTQAGRRGNNLRDLARATAATDLDFGSGWRFAARVVEAEQQGSSPGSLYFPSVSSFDQTASLVSLQLSRKFSGATLASLKFTDTRVWGLYDANTTGQSTSFVTRSSLFADLNTSLTDTLLLRSFGDFSYDSLAASYVGSSQYSQHDADFGQTLQVAVTPEISLQPSYRYQSRFGQWFKALAALYSVARSTTSLRYSEGFRAPSLSDRFATYSTFIASPGLQPERSSSVELGEDFLSGRRFDGFLEGFELKGSAYYTSYRDLVDTLTTGPSFTKVNAGDARSVGGELSAAYGFHVWMFNVGYNYMDARNTSLGEPLRLAPRHQGVVSLAQLLGPVLIEAKEIIWSSFFDRDPSSGLLRELPSWKTFDLTFRTLALTRWEFSGGVLNLFDQPRELTIGYPEPQRRFFLAGSRSF